MSRPLLPLILLSIAACTSTAPVVSRDAGTLIDAGAPIVDAGPTQAVLADHPTLQQLVDWWDAAMACRLYACDQRVRETPATCALARQADGIPYDTFRLALAAVSAGRATYDIAAGTRCATFLKSVDLSAECFGQSAISFRDLYGPDFVSDCTTLIHGTVAQDGVCAQDQECVTGGSCVFSRTQDCSGQCIVWLTQGASCVDRPNDCVQGTYCNGTQCQARQLSADGTACYDDGASCRSGKCFDYQCKTVSPLNGECVGEGDCAPGLYCKPLPPSTGQLGICKPPQSIAQPCGYTDHCAGNQSCDGYFWAWQGGWTPGTCGDKPNDVGGSCVPISTGYDYGDTGCFNDLACNPSTSKCVEAPAVGDACATPGSRCGFGAWCDPRVVCRAKKAPGEAAETAAECRDQYDSFEKKCYRQTDRDRCGQF